MTRRATAASRRLVARPARVGALAALGLALGLAGVGRGAGARAQDDEAAAPRIELRGASPHAAARFVAAVHGVGVWLAGPADAPVSFAVEGPAPDAFEALAAATGLGARRRFERGPDVYWLADEARLLRAEAANVRGLSGGRRVSLDHEAVSARALGETLAEASHVSLRGAPLGAVTVYLPSTRAMRAIAHLARLSNARAGRRGRQVTLRLGSLPEGPARARCATDRADVALPCASAVAVRLVGLAPDRALLAAGEAPAAIVEVGDRVGAQGWRVETLGSEGVELARGEARRALRWDADEAPAAAPDGAREPG